MNSQPPKWAIKLLHFYCKPSKLEVIEGDLFELFDIRQIESNSTKAKRRFFWDVIRFFRWRNIKGLEDIHSLTTIAMFRNYFKVSIRSLIRHKFYSIINIFGLTIGTACCLFILLFVNHEFSYDNFWKDSDQIYRVTINKYGASTPAQLVKQMREDFPEIYQGARIQGSYDATFQLGDKVIKQEGGFDADSTIFDVFDIQFLYGDAKTALVQPNTVVLSRNLALKYFPDENALNKVIKVDGIPTKITGIINDASTNSHFQYEFITSMPREDWVTKGFWTGNNFYSYLRLNENVDADFLESKFPGFVKKYVGPEIISFSGHNSFEEFLAEDNSYSFNLVPLKDIHLNHPTLSLGNPGKLSNVYIFSIVAFFILLIACINFMNLSTARSATRSKEVGVRKVLGSIRSQLVGQFMVESILICIVSLFLSIILVLILLPQFNAISGKIFAISDIFTLENLVWLMLIGIVAGLLAGSYPALYLSKIQPVDALKGVLKNKKGSEFLRRTLVSFQFGISILIIISTIIVYAQIDFMVSKDLGLNAKQTLVIKNANKLDKNLEAFTNQLQSIPQIKSTCLSSHYPSYTPSNWSYNTVEDIPIRMAPYHLFVDESFLDVLKVDLIEGRFFDSSISSDTAAVIVNETFIKNTIWETGVGKQVTRGKGSRFNIIGVVKDFHFHSMRAKIRPLIMRYNTPGRNGFGGINYMMVNVNNDFISVLSKIEEQWKLNVPNDPFEYLFLDDSFNNLYQSERKFGELFSLFAVLAIFIGSLGMLALATFVIERRIKEIAIRKVMGASIFQIISLLLFDFTKLVLIGGFIALPLAYFLGNEWLSNFEFQTNLGLYIYISPILLVVIISWITVGYQTYNTAKSNPATVLQNE
jgi:putative ABC transport system permease protein